jgi:hypothetical protein
VQSSQQRIACSWKPLATKTDVIAGFDALQAMRNKAISKPVSPFVTNMGKLRQNLDNLDEV